MILAVDSSALALLINPRAIPPVDPTTGKPVTLARERVENFISSLTVSDTMIIPTPVLAEALVRAEEGGPGLLETLAGMARVRIRPFGERAAVETAMMTRQALLAGDKRDGSNAPWQKVKVDRQIIAVARVEGATRIYADDRDLIAFAQRLGMDVISTWNLEPPQQDENLFTVAGVLEQLPPAAVNESALGVTPCEPIKKADEATEAEMYDDAVIEASLCDLEEVEHSNMTDGESETTTAGEIETVATSDPQLETPDTPS